MCPGSLSPEKGDHPEALFTIPCFSLTQQHNSLRVYERLIVNNLPTKLLRCTKAQLHHLNTYKTDVKEEPKSYHLVNNLAPHYNYRMGFSTECANNLRGASWVPFSRGNRWSRGWIVMTVFAEPYFFIFWEKLQARCTWCQWILSITRFEREQHVLTLSISKMLKPCLLITPLNMLKWKWQALPSSKEQWSVQSAQTFPALINPGEPWGLPRIVPSWLSHWQQQQVTPLLTRDCTPRARTCNSYSGIATDSCWQYNFPTLNLLFATRFADSVKKEIHALIERYIIEDGLSLCSWNIAIDGVKNMQHKGLNVYTERQSGK